MASYTKRGENYTSVTKTQKVGLPPNSISPRVYQAHTTSFSLLKAHRVLAEGGGKDITVLQSCLDLLKNEGVRVVFRPDIHQKRIVWYGSIILLSFGSAEESIMRLESPNIANELFKIA